MHTRTISLIIVCFLGIVAIAGSDTTPTTLPANHGIYGINETISNWPVDPVRFLPGKGPEITFTLPKREYLIGEPIEGTLRIVNPKTGIRVALAPPYRGAMVDTVEIWASHTTTDTDRRTMWTEVIPVMRLNKGQYAKSLPATYAGKVVVLEPGQEANWRIPINIGQPTMRFGTPPSWLPCVGFASEGRYRVYLKYLNLAGGSVSAAKTNKGGEDSAKKAKHFRETVVAFPVKPVVIGPYDITIKPREEGVDLAVKNVCRDCGKDYRNGKLQKGTVPALDDKQIKKAVDALKKSDALSAASIELAIIRHHLQQRASKETLEVLLKECQAAEKSIADGILKDAYALTECYILKALGKTEEAIRCAEKQNTPDAQVFIGLEKAVARKTKDRKKQPASSESSPKGRQKD